MRRVALLIALVIVGALAVTPVVAQRDDQLDTPLLMANSCGAGTPGDVQFTLAATGDTFPHENIQAVGETEGYDVLFDHVRPFLQAADVAYTNFDGAMLEGSGYTGYPNFNYNPALAAALKNAGIGLVSTANNHIMNRGPAGLDATLDVLARNAILQHGTIASTATGQPRPAYLPLTLTRDGVSLKLAFLSFSWGTNGIPDPYGQVNLLWNGDDYGQQTGLRQSVLDDIARAKRENDIVVVAAHWGHEYEFYPNDEQKYAAAEMVAAGADVILGAQPHTLQPVDIIAAGNRRGLVIYSLANFLASQGAFQAQSYSATSVIFYVGMVRHADGSAEVTGYRYLPTIHIDYDTRPAPIQSGEYPEVIDHVRLMMRDFAGLRQLAPDPAALGTHVDVCSALTLPGATPITVSGDFAQFYATLGGAASRPPGDALLALGAPIGTPRQEPAGDCGPPISVLYTENQRLELHPELPWPYRVSGTQLGALAYQQRYGGSDPLRHTDLTGGAFADERFRAFFERYGGLPVFGYPISPMLTELGQDGRERQVQYFERARLELADQATIVPAALGREAAAQGGVCAAVAAVAKKVTPEMRAIVQPVQPSVAQTSLPLVASQGVARPWWLLILLALGIIIAVYLIVRGLGQSMPPRRPRRRAVARPRAQREPPTDSNVS